MKTVRKTLATGKRSWWALSHISVVHIALSNAYFVDHGLASLERLWEAKHRQVIVPMQQCFTWG